MANIIDKSGTPRYPVFGVRLTSEIAKYKKSGGSIKEMFEAAGITRSALTKYKQGKRIPRWPEMVRLAEVFGVDPDWLAGKTDKPLHESVPAHSDRLPYNFLQYKKVAETLKSLIDVFFALSPEDQQVLLDNTKHLAKGNRHEHKKHRGGIRQKKDDKPT